MANQINKEQDKEIDLSQVTARAKKYFTRANDSFFDGILFLKRNIIIVAILLIGGGVLGYFMDFTSKAYTNKIIVTPNFKSVDYLYEAVNQIEMKIKEKDTAFLKGIGIKNPKDFSRIEVKPLIDIYNYIDEYEPEEANSTTNKKFQVLELMSENGSIKDVVEEPTTSKNYRNHLIIIKAKKKANLADLVEPVMKYLNNNPHYRKLMDVELNNISSKIAANDTIIRQLDKMFAYIVDPARNTGSSTVYYNDNTQMAEAMRLKENILQQQGKLRLDQVNFVDVIRENGKMLNQKVTDGTAGKMKFIIPLVLFALYIFMVLFRKYYRNQMNKRKAISTHE
jgi:hypothetical protein